MPSLAKVSWQDSPQSARGEGKAAGRVLRGGEWQRAGGGLAERKGNQTYVAPTGAGVLMVLLAAVCPERPGAEIIGECASEWNHRARTRPSRVPGDSKGFMYMSRSQAFVRYTGRGLRLCAGLGLQGAAATGGPLLPEGGLSGGGDKEQQQRNNENR